MDGNRVHARRRYAVCCDLFTVAKFGANTGCERPPEFVGMPASIDAAPIQMNWTRMPHITEHDHRRNDPGGDRTADHESVGEGLADAMRHEKSPVPIWKRKSANTSGCRMSLR